MTNYLVTLKTSQSELMALNHLSEDVKDWITPLVEVGKSRRTKNLPEGDIDKSLSYFLERYPNRPYFLDITTHPDLNNSQIEALFDETDGYNNWVSFIAKNLTADVTPVLQVVADSDTGLVELSKQASMLSLLCGKVALRIAYDEVMALPILQAVLAGLSNPARLTVIFDVGFVPLDAISVLSTDILATYRQMEKLIEHCEIILLSSSYPRSVALTGYGDDETGSYSLQEPILHEHVSASLGRRVVYGDYASIHPIRYTTRGGTWIPRIDMPLETSLYFYRVRHASNSQGYIQAAGKVIGDTRYTNFKCWGNEQIVSAAKGQPPGRNPSFWIAVRANIHITAQKLRLSRVAT